MDEPPKLGERANGGVKGAIGVAGDGEGLPDDGLYLGAGWAAGIGAGEVGVVAMDAEKLIDGVEFREGGVDGSLCLCRLLKCRDGNKGAKVRL